ncbi:MAG TPA: glutamine synthetase family protein [Actinomycetota bacterium]|nr:glutamine synthetase family protein [Actinomycetota bacterium]
MQLRDAERFLSDLDTVECCFPDTWGVFVGRRMPAPVFLRAAERGISMPNAPFAWNVRGDIDAVPFTNPDTGFPNMHVMPDLSTLRPAPWADRTAFCLMDAFLEPGGDPHPLDTRAIARRAVASLADTGYEAWVGPELELYLTTPDGQPLYDDHRCWSMTLGAEYEPILGEIRSTLLAAGVPVESTQTEGGPGQWEINVAPAAPVQAADHAAILKYVVKVVARRHGVRATFMPMPFQSVEGSGHHLHESLRARGGTANVFAEDDAVFGGYLAGVLEHMVDLTAVNLPSVNAYKRLKDYTFAPNRVCWALDNRTAAVRIPAGDPEDRRLEIRTGSSDANPYLIVAGTVAAGADGIARRLTPPPPIEGDAYRDDALERLPATIGAAADLFEGSAFCKDVFGEVFVETFSLLCRREEAAYREHVSDWERARYLEPS